MSDLVVILALIAPVVATGVYGIWLHEEYMTLGRWRERGDLVMLAAIACGFWPISLPYLIYAHWRLCHE